MIHTEIRSSVITALREVAPPGTTFFDGRPAFIDATDLPAIAVYISGAECSESQLDGEMWSAELHIEVFLKATEPDTALDTWVESRIHPVMADIPALDSLTETLLPVGYDYQRDDEATTWGSVDLRYSITYQM
ncbi:MULTISPECIES: phage tail terminator protein [Kosakonia]|uniref:Phage minor tail protein U n=1 Tax=Kosakonia oryzae TaxID=497725 RepID=A0AA94H481_9ENTR|nr:MULTISPECIES: phage tail terminator protein [Kosakonia]ANI82412.1 phage tail protein [Kosakonia oryzae]SFC57251.1 Phage minor tail protein U [Kosakonia oryzae]